MDRAVLDDAEGTSQGRSPEPDSTAAAFGIEPIDWDAFWSRQHSGEEWALESVLPAGRQAGVYAAAKVGKSLLALDMAAARATGRPVLGQSPSSPLTVAYLDLEMSEDDLWERLDDLGYGPEDDLSRLAYYSLPSLPPLDTALGGKVLSDLVAKCGATVVVLDTMARVVFGEENLADTYRRFYRYTGRLLKEAGVALLRLDHEGKTSTHGARGSSAKDDDLDVVWRLSAVEGRLLKLARMRSRVPWVPAEVLLRRDEDPVLCHRLARDAVPAGTAEAAQLLDELEVPLDATSATAMRALKDAGKGRRKMVVLAAQKHRRSRSG